jgi:hypothetical protein
MMHTPKKTNGYEDLFPVDVTLEPPMSPAGSVVRNVIIDCMAGTKGRRPDNEDVLVAKRRARRIPLKNIAFVGLTIVFLVVLAILFSRPGAVFIPESRLKVDELGSLGRALRLARHLSTAGRPSGDPLLRGNAILPPVR